MEERFGANMTAIRAEGLRFIDDYAKMAGGMENTNPGVVLRDYALYYCKKLHVDSAMALGESRVVLNGGGMLGGDVLSTVQIPNTNITCSLDPPPGATLPPGVWSFVSLQCAPGYEGNLCGSCNRDPAKGPIFSLEEPFECTGCQNAGSWLAGSVVSTSFFIFLTTFFTMYSNQKDTGKEAGVSDVVKAMIFFI